MNKLEQAARQAPEALERHTEQTRPLASTNAAIGNLREALKVTEASISDHKSENVMVSVNFLRQVEQLLIEFKMDEEYEWGNCRPLEVMEEKKLLPEEVYQIRKILEEAPVFGYTHAHTSGKPLHHFALVLRDLDKTVDGWCEEPEFYLNGKRVALAEQAEQEPVGRWNWNEAKFEWLTKFDYYKHHMTPLYAAPIRTKDLTDDEIRDAVSHPMTMMKLNDARAVIAKLKEKTNG